MIHKTAIIHPSSELDSSVHVGAYSIIEENVRINKDTKIESHVIIKKTQPLGVQIKYINLVQLVKYLKT